MTIAEPNSIFQQLDLSSLKHFFAVASFGGFSKASRATGISQPALSLGLQKLEKTLGTSLVNRESKPFSLTPAGIRLLEFCRHLEGNLEEIVTELGTESLSVKRRVRIGTAFSVGFSPLIELCQEAGKRSELIELDLIADGSFELMDQLASGSIDLAFLPDDVNDSRLLFLPLIQDTVSFVVAPTFARIFDRLPWKQAIQQIPLVTYPRETPMRHLVDRICLKEKLAFQSLFSVGGIEALKLLAMHGVGGAFVLRSLAERELASRALISPAGVPTSFSRRGIMMAVRRGEEGEAVAKLALKLLKKKDRKYSFNTQ